MWLQAFAGSDVVEDVTAVESTLRNLGAFCAMEEFAGKTPLILSAAAGRVPSGWSVQPRSTASGIRMLAGLSHLAEGFGRQ